MTDGKSRDECNRVEERGEKDEVRPDALPFGRQKAQLRQLLARLHQVPAALRVLLTEAELTVAVRREEVAIERSAYSNSGYAVVILDPDTAARFEAPREAATIEALTYLCIR